MALTEFEWWALCAAHAERDLNLEVRSDDEGEATGRERAALQRAMKKVRDELAPKMKAGTTR